MVDKNIIYKHLEVLENSISKIRNMDFSLDAITKNEDTRDLIDRRMQKAIESCISIAAHIVAANKLGQADTSGSLFRILGKREIIAPDLAKQLEKAVGLRNIIVHEYTKIDYRLAYDNLENKLTNLENFAKKIKDYLQNQN